MSENSNTKVLKEHFYGTTSKTSKKIPLNAIVSTANNHRSNGILKFEKSNKLFEEYYF